MILRGFPSVGMRRDDDVFQKKRIGEAQVCIPDFIPEIVIEDESVLEIQFDIDMLNADGFCTGF